jgi:DNA mismatch repair protein MSH3
VRATLTGTALLAVDGSKEIVFLYRLVSGLATRSFGVWVGKLAGLPQVVLDRAQEKGDELRLRQITKLVDHVLTNAANASNAVPVPASQAIEVLAGAKSILTKVL